MQSYLVNQRTKLRKLVLLILVVWGFFFAVKIGHADNVDQLCRSAPLLIDGLEAKSNGFTEIGSACYGSGESLKIRVSVAISPGHKDLEYEKLQTRDLLRLFCESEELYKLAREIPIVWTYYTMEGVFHSEFPLNMDMCEKHLNKK